MRDAYRRLRRSSSTWWHSKVRCRNDPSTQPMDYINNIIIIFLCRSHAPNSRFIVISWVERISGTSTRWLFGVFCIQRWVLTIFIYLIRFFTLFRHLNTLIAYEYKPLQIAKCAFDWRTKRRRAMEWSTCEKFIDLINLKHKWVFCSQTHRILIIR